jgi:hypothetical protein
MYISFGSLLESIHSACGLGALSLNWFHQALCHRNFYIRERDQSSIPLRGYKSRAHNLNNLVALVRVSIISLYVHMHT